VDARTVRRWLGDGLVAGVLLAFGLLATPLATEAQPDAAHLDAVGYGLIAITALALAGRRRWPTGVLAVATAATTVYLARGYAYGPILVAFSIAAYTVAVTLPVRSAALLAGAALVGLTLHVVVPSDGEPGLIGLAPAAAWVVVPFAVGVTVRLSREAAARATADAARRIADDERLRVAQEVHDVVGHGLAAINMQAEIALHLLHRKPEQAEAALTAISRTSKEGLDELRATLTAVRRGGDRAPTPGLAQLPALRDRLGHAGLPVTVSVVGEPAAGELPAAVDLAGYRIVQEALTNVLRHAGRTSAQVRVQHRSGAVEVEVTDTGLGGPPSPGGTGIAGMRERATALGGELHAGPRPGGGFRVRAVLPLPSGSDRHLTGEAAP
jgi:signal transduction histidine kinase